MAVLSAAMRKRAVGWAAVAMLAVSPAVMVAGCGADDPDEQSGWATNGDDDVGADADAGGFDDVGDVEDNGNDNGGEDNGNDNGGDDNGDEPDEDPQMVTGACGPMLELGELQFGDDYQLELELADFDNILTTECGNGVGDSPAIVAFDTPLGETGTLQVTSDDDVAVDLRRGGCTDDSADHRCFVDDVAEIMDPGAGFYAIIESRDGAQDELTVQFEFDEVQRCQDGEENTSVCDDATIEACQLIGASPDIWRWVTNHCPSGTCTGDRCQGDSCDDPIPVTSSFQWSGTNRGFFDEYNRINEIDDAQDAGEDPTCITDDEEGLPRAALHTAGWEMVFELQDLEVGDQVDIDIDFGGNPDNLTVLIQDSCDDEAACTEAWSSDDEMTFQAPDAGDFYLIVDTRYEFDDYFEIEIDINDD